MIDRVSLTRAILAAVLLVGGACSRTASAQPAKPTRPQNPAAKEGPLEEPTPVRPVIELRPRSPASTSPGPVIDDNRPHVSVDDELARLFHEAESLAGQGEHGLAAKRYQQLLDASPLFVTDASVTARDAETSSQPATSPATTAKSALRHWLPWSSLAEQSLLRAPAALQSAYRLVAEGEARETSASLAATGDVDRLTLGAEISRRYLLTTSGLDATWSLSGRALDDGDFVAAARLLERFRAAAPPTDSRHPMAVLRMAVACAHLGDRSAVRSALEAEQSFFDDRQGKQPRRPSSTATSRAIEHELTSADRATVRDFVLRQLASPGVPIGDQQLPATPDWVSAIDGTHRPTDSSERVAPVVASVISVWHADFDRQQLAHIAGRPAPGNAEPARRIAAALRLLDPRSLENGYDDVLPRLDPASVSRRWLSRVHFASAPVIAHNGHWLGTWIDRTVRRSPVLAIPGPLNTGPLNPDSPNPDSPNPGAPNPDSWSRPFAAGYSFPTAWKALPGTRVAMRPAPVRFEPADLPVAIDPVHGALAANERLVFVVEPDRLDDAQVVIRNAARATSLRARANVLVAYELATGEERWRAESQSVEPSEPVVDAGFIGSPLATETRVFAPRVERGVVVVVARNAETGELCWESNLCAEPRAGCWPWSNVTLTWHGADLYVATGAGAVFALDAATGGIRWGREYERAVERRRDLTLSTSNSGGASGSSGSTQAFDATLDGWDEDRIWVVGRTLVVAASDAAELRALDCRDGRTLWTTPRRLPDGRAASYVVGANSRQVIVGGATFLRGYDIESGKLVWTSELLDKAGRATLTRDIILVPRIAPLRASTVSRERARDDRAGILVLHPETGATLADVSIAVRRPHAPVSLAVSAQRLAWREPHRLIEVADGASSSGQTATAGSSRTVNPVAADREGTNANPVPNAAPAGTGSASWRPTPVTGRVLVSDLSAGKLSELTLAGQVVWQRDGFDLPGPVCGLANGRRFVYSHGEETLLEVDESGVVRTRFADLPGRPASLTGSSDGKLLLTFPDADLLGEFDPQTRTFESRRCTGRPVDARREADGATLITLLADQRVLRIAAESWPFARQADSQEDAAKQDAAKQDASKQDAAAVANVASPKPVDGLLSSLIRGGVELPFPRSAQRRRDGQLLVCLPREGQVIQTPDSAESMPGARVIRAGLRGLQAAIELPNGQLLVADQNGLTVWDAERVVWKQPDILVGGVSAW